MLHHRLFRIGYWQVVPGSLEGGFVQVATVDNTLGKMTPQDLNSIIPGLLQKLSAVSAFGTDLAVHPDDIVDMGESS